MEIRFENKVAFITGAAGGIGYAAARMFAEAGASVVMADLDSRVTDRAKELEAEGHNAIGIRCDVSDEVQVKAACDNPDIQKLYAEFFDGKPMSHKAHHMLHTTFVSRAEDLGPNGACTPATCPTSVPNLKKAAEAAKAAAEANK